VAFKASGETLKRSLARAREIPEERRNEQVTLDGLAKATALSRFYLVRSFVKKFGLPPHAYLINVRMKHACRLLRAGMPCNTGCRCNGICRPKSFRAAFPEDYGCGSLGLSCLAELVVLLVITGTWQRLLPIHI
jgi:AraC-like DNA-binding protein